MLNATNLSQTRKVATSSDLLEVAAELIIHDGLIATIARCTRQLVLCGADVRHTTASLRYTGTFVLGPLKVSYYYCLSRRGRTVGEAEWLEHRVG